MVSGGQARVIVARETWDDVVRLQRPLPPRPERREAPGGQGREKSRHRAAGYGMVGSGVGKLLRENAEEIRLATGKDVYLRRVLRVRPRRPASRCRTRLG